MVVGHRQIRRQLRRAGRRRQIAQIDVVGRCRADRTRARVPGAGVTMNPRAVAVPPYAAARPSSVIRGPSIVADERSRCAPRSRPRRRCGPSNANVPLKSIGGRRARRLGVHREVERRVPGEIAALRRVLQDRRQIQALDVDVAARGEVRRLRRRAVSWPRTRPASDCTSTSSARRSAGPFALRSIAGCRSYPAAAGTIRPISGSDTLPGRRRA